MRKSQKRWILLAYILIVVLTSATRVRACGGGTPPVPPDPNLSGPSTGGPPPIDPNVTGPGNSGGCNGPTDPVLLNTGEFLFTRTDAVIPGSQLDFPIVRSYRDKPTPLVRHDGREVSTIYYSDWIPLIWDKPPVYTEFPDSCWQYSVSFNITHIAGNGGGNYEETSLGNAFLDMGYWCVQPYPTPASGKEGKAVRFELGTGDSFKLELVYTRGNPLWLWTNGSWKCTANWTFTEVYRWEQIITIPEWPQENYPTTPTPESSPLSGGESNRVPDLEWKPGWDMSYNIHLLEIRDPNEADSTDGRRIYLYPGDTNLHEYAPASESHPVYGEIWTCTKRDDFLKKWSSGAYTLYRKHNETWQFNPEGYIQYISRQGTMVTFNYADTRYGMGETRRLDSIEDHFGRKTELIYTDSSSFYPGNLQKIRDWTGREWGYDYYADGNLKSVTDPNGYKETYHYSGGILKKVEDNDENIWLENGYDTEGRINSQLVGGYELEIDYDSTGVTVTDANGWDSTHVLNDDGYEISRTVDTDTGTVTTLFERNSQNKLTKITYPEENGYDLVYDPNGNLTSVAAFSSDISDPNLTYTLTGTDDDWNFLKTITDPRGNTTTYTYDYEDPNYTTSDGLLMKITYPEVPTDTEPNTPEIHFTYDPNNQLETITSPDGIVLKYEYWTDANEPNSLGKVKKVILDDGQAQECLNIEYTFDYDSTGRVVDVNDPFGNTTTLTYNVLDLLAQIEDPNNNITKLTYNADRKLEKVERAFNGGWQTFEYGHNIMAKLNSITDSLGHETTLDYDDRFQVKEVTDSNTNATKKRYNARRLIKEIIDAEDGSTTFDYDDNGRLSVVTDAEDADTTYDYDGYGRLEYVTYADNSFEEYGYDDNGNLTSFTNRADETITFGYDALNRLIDKKVGTDPNIVLTYDIAGRLVEVSQSTDEMTFDYDRLGRLESTTDQNDRTVGSDYDAMGRRIKLTYPDNSYTTYHYDASGRLEYIKDEDGYPIVHYVYDGLSRPAYIDYYRGTSYVGSMDYDYEDANSLIDDDLGNRIERIDYSFNTSSNHHISYTYDNVGNVTSTDVGGASGDYGRDYVYDDIYQLTEESQWISDMGYWRSYQYDAVYNRTNASGNPLLGGSYNITYDANEVNQYATITGVSPNPTYDSRGNMTSGYGGGLTLGYDAENRLTDAGSVSYTYDLLGRRISRTYNSVTTTYVWDGAHIIAEYTGSSLTKKYIYGPGMDNPVAMINVSGSTETWYYYYADALGSVRLLSDSGGSIVESYTYDPFGLPSVMTAAGTDGNWLTEDGATYSYSDYGNPYMFTARRWDAVTNVYYYRFRDYSPQLGRFLQTDPAGYIDTMNLYAYCGNNPVNWIDPWGLCSKEGGPDGGSGGEVTAEFPIGTDPYLEDMYKHPENWEPIGEGIREPGRGKTKESYKQDFRNTKTGEERGIHDKNPRGGKAKHPHTYPVRTPVFIWIVPMLEQYFEILMPSYMTQPQNGPSA